MSRKILFIGVVLLLLVGVFVFIRTRGQANAGIAIETQPAATVFLDGEQVGITPYKTERRPGSVTIKLIPFAQGLPLVPYQTEVTLISGIETVIRRNFAPTEEESSGEVLFFEKIGGRAASIAVVSNPDSAQITLDGSLGGFTPIKIDAVEVGAHTLQVSSPGFSEHEIDVQTVAGYKLTAVVKLAKLPEQKEEAEGTKKQVEILTTPTGFLRVREGPSTAATESARVTPGKRYSLLEENQDGSWYKIEYLPAQAGLEGKTGWISAQYVKKIEE